MFQRLKNALPKLLLVLFVIVYFGRSFLLVESSTANTVCILVATVAFVAAILLSDREWVWSVWLGIAVGAASIFVMDFWSTNGSTLDIVSNIGIVLALAGLIAAYVLVNQKIRTPTVIPQSGEPADGSN